MKENSKIFIKSEAGPVWDWIGFPSRWSEFHDKIQSIVCERPAEGAPVLVDLEFSNKLLHFSGAITRYDVGREIHIKLVEEPAEEGKPAPGMTVAYLVKRHPGKLGVRVFETVNYDMKLPPWAAVIVGILSKIGKAQSPSTLQNLKRILETGQR